MHIDVRALTVNVKKNICVNNKNKNIYLESSMLSD